MFELTQENKTSPDQGEITQLLVRWREGDESALNRLTAMVYDDLVRVAKVRLRGESKAPTLQPTALVHEVYLPSLPESRRRFFAATSFRFSFGEPSKSASLTLPLPVNLVSGLYGFLAGVS